ncbi:uncharacterized protein [Musca autumnalis]|uniref:uncharacterized protein n=1 Tax=Musca autumnalis TaxID=221902 RepID=UPI003CF0F1A1
MTQETVRPSLSGGNTHLVGDSHRENAPATNSTQIFAARIAKLPPFWREEPEIWFLQVESSFNLNGITQDSTKYEYLLSNLDPSILFVLKDIVVNPPATGRYAAMKARIIKHFAESDESQLKKLLSGLELGDQKPSHLLHRMKSLAGTRVSNEMMRTLFMDRLPENVKCILAVTDTADLDNLAGIADKICEQFSASTTISEISSNNKTNQDSSGLVGKLDQIIQRIDALERRSRQHQPNRNVQVQRSRSKSRSRKDSGLCWYHWRFADKASKCVQPCKFQSSKN